MTTIEEQIWDYIDGNGDDSYRAAIADKIASDPVYSSLYEEFTAIHLQMGQLSLDEPSMAFSRNIMEMIETVPAPVSLKTRLDNRIIYSIAAFFVAALLAILTIAISQSHFSIEKIALNINFERYLSPSSIKLFLFIDSCIALLYFDRLLRKKRV